MTLKGVYAVSPRAVSYQEVTHNPLNKVLQNLSTEKLINLIHINPLETQKLRTQQFHFED